MDADGLISDGGLGHHHYKEEDIVLLVDDSKNPRQHPTRKNILEAMRWLVKGARPNDSLFFHCAYQSVSFRCRFETESFCI